MTWVVSDYTATPGTNEVSVTKGQQVEIIDTPNAEPSEYCLVRLGPMGSGDGGTHEGLVPISILKPPPSSKGVSRRGLEVEKEQPESNGEFFYMILFFNITKNIFSLSKCLQRICLKFTLIRPSRRRHVIL